MELINFKGQEVYDLQYAVGIAIHEMSQYTVSGFNLGRLERLIEIEKKIQDEKIRVWREYRKDAILKNKLEAQNEVLKHLKKGEKIREWNAKRAEIARAAIDRKQSGQAGR